MDIDNLKEKLNNIENKVSFYQTIDSTNSELMRRLKEAGSLLEKDGKLNAKGLNLHKSAAAAFEQSAGRGRLGRNFFSPSESGVYFSFIYIPEAGVKDPSVYTITSAVCVCRAIKELFNKDCSIKWVNDIYLKGKKICGILTEGLSNPETGLIEAAVVGIGINIRLKKNIPSELKDKAGSILEEGEKTSISRKDLILTCLRQVYKSLDSAENVIEEYRTKSMLTGKYVTVTPLIGDDKSSYQAKVIGICDDAGLKIQDMQGKTRILHSGEVTLH